MGTLLVQRYENNCPSSLQTWREMLGRAKWVLDVAETRSLQPPAKIAQVLVLPSYENALCLEAQGLGEQGLDEFDVQHKTCKN